MSDIPPNRYSAKISATTATALCALLLFAVVAVLFGDIFVTGAPVVPGNAISDAGRFFAGFRSFAYEEMARGNIPLWNPYIYCGTPCLAACQAALFYPLNLHYFVLPLAKSISLEIALHTYLLGLFVFFWARHWKMRRSGATFAAIAAMLGTPFYLQLFSGHLSMTSALPWAVFALYSADAYLDTRRWKFVLTGALALTLDFLGGHPQIVFETGVVLGLYVALRLVNALRRLRALPGLAVFACAPFFLSAAQLWPALQIMDETVRSGGLTFDASGSVSMPPENLITFLAPFFFGNDTHVAYWGRGLYWEVSAYVGVATLLLAYYGLLKAGVRARFAWFATAAIVGILALGVYTPVYGLFWRYVPGFDMFRVPARFFAFSALFLAMLSGLGAHELIERAPRARALWIPTALLTLPLLAGAWLIWKGNPGAWLDWLNAGNRSWAVSPGVASDFARRSAMFAIQSLVGASVLCVAFAALFALAPKYPKCRAAILLLGTAELFAVAYSIRGTVNLDELRNPQVEAFLAERPIEVRVCDRRITNDLILKRVRNVWGYDSAALRRYVEMMAATQDADVDSVHNEFAIRRAHPLFAALNCAYIIDSRAENARRIRTLPEPMPRFSFPASVLVERDKEKRLALMRDRKFNPRETLILETEPIPQPDAGAAIGDVSVRDENSDAFTLEVNVDRNAVLLISDAYAKSWSAVPLENGPQMVYDVLPANQGLRAIPLTAGRHVIRVSYLPGSYFPGLWVSSISWLLLVISGILAFRNEKRPSIVHTTGVAL